MTLYISNNKYEDELKAIQVIDSSSDVDYLYSPSCGDLEFALSVYLNIKQMTISCGATTKVITDINEHQHNTDISRIDIAEIEDVLECPIEIK